MTRPEWNGEPADVIGDAELSDDVGAEGPGEPAEPETLPWPWERAERGLAVATVAFAAACLARVAVRLWPVWQPGLRSGAPALATWQRRLLNAGVHAGDVQVLLVVTVLTAAALVGVAGLVGRFEADAAGGGRAGGWRRATQLSLCAACVAGVVLVFYLLVLVLVLVGALRLLAMVPPRESSANLVDLFATAGQAVLIVLGCVTAAAGLARYALARHRLAAAQPRTPQ